MRKRGGDFATADMEKRVVEINGDIVRDWRRFNPQSARTICVGVSVEHAHTVAALFRAEGIAAEAVDGKTPKPQRAAIFNRFRNGDTVVLCACAVVDEGLDVPEATVLQITRPTASLRLWLQLLGRVLRPAPGKAEALIIDHTDNWRRLPAPHRTIDWQLNQKEQKPRSAKQAVLDPDTLEVTTTDPVPTEVESNGLALVEITPELLAMTGPQRARKLINDRCCGEIAEVVAGKRRSDTLKPWLKRVEVLEDDTVRALGSALGMPPGWADGQLMLNGFQSPGQRLAKTKQLQISWA
jgi:superfamily II DNA or RNA helicase